MARLSRMIVAASCLAIATVAVATTTTVDKRSYLAAPAYAAKYIALRTPAYIAALTPAADGRLLGHLPYADAVAAPIDALVGIETAYRTKQCDMLPVAANAAEAMIRAANAQLGGNSELRAQSCFRSISEQVGIFCNKVRNAPSAKCITPAERAVSSAPPGHSEHATGYTLDLVACRIKPKRVCSDLDSSFSASDAGKWMLAHAAEYGFELSFPKGNSQGVTYEPWHWRWVGRHGDASADALRARSIFAHRSPLFCRQSVNRPGVAGGLGLLTRADKRSSNASLATASSQKGPGRSLSRAAPLRGSFSVSDRCRRSCG